MGVSFRQASCRRGGTDAPATASARWTETSAGVIATCASCSCRPLGSSSSLEEAPKIITLHHATLDRYVETVDALVTSIAEHAEAEDDCGSLVKAFRALVHSVTVHPNGPREGFQVEVEGKLAVLIGAVAMPSPKQSIVGALPETGVTHVSGMDRGRVVAEERIEPPAKRGLTHQEQSINITRSRRRRNPCQSQTARPICFGT